MAQLDRFDERKATQERNAARKAKHDAPYAARVLSDPTLYDPTRRNDGTHAMGAYYSRGGSWS